MGEEMAFKMGRAKIKVEKSPDFKRIYVTGAYGVHNPYDFRLGFYRDDMEFDEEAMMGRAPPTVRREVVIEIVLPPSAAKMLAEQLSRAIKDYEAKYGKIPLPPAPERKAPEGMFA